MKPHKPVIVAVDDFTKVRGWRIVSWEPKVDPSESGDIPLDLFRNPSPAKDVAGSTLLIGKGPTNRCHFAWIDADMQWWTVIDGLPFNSQTGHLTAEPAIFYGPNPFIARLDLSIDPLTGELRGAINDPFRGGNSGSFIAEANPIGTKKPHSGKK